METHSPSLLGVSPRRGRASVWAGRARRRGHTAAIQQSSLRTGACLNLSLPEHNELPSKHCQPCPQHSDVQSSSRVHTPLGVLHYEAGHAAVRGVAESLTRLSESTPPPRRMPVTRGRDCSAPAPPGAPQLPGRLPGPGCGLCDSQGLV